MEKTRVQKIIADSGYCSRRRAEEYIQAKAVKVNGRIVSIGDKADAQNDLITVNGEKINSSVNLRYIKMYKPRGYITTTADKHGNKIVTDLLSGISERVYPVGRLDRNSEGLILLTNDGEFANGITHPSRRISKIYRVTVPAAVSDDVIARLSAGVDIGEGDYTRPCIINVTASGTSADGKPRTVLEFIITEGKNRQIRRMCEAVSLPVSRLRRVSVGGVRLGMLKPGEYADLSREELLSLKQLTGYKGKSGNESFAKRENKKRDTNVKIRSENRAGKGSDDDNYKKNTGRTGKQGSKRTGNQ